MTIPTPPLRFGVAYDFRNPAGFDGLSNAQLYAEVLEQAAVVDALGFDQIWLTEHHFVEDGYLPSFVAAAGALAACTKRVRISTDVALLPFHNALKLAEDMAVGDTLSGGRMELGVGMGYAVHEFDAFGVPRPQRVSRTEEAVQVLRQAWSDAPVNFRGKRYAIENVHVFPKPVQPGGIPLWMAAQSEGSARRAAELGMNLLPQGTRSATIDTWSEALRARGDTPARYRVGIIRSLLVSDDPARDWAWVKPSEVYRMREYTKWAETAADDVADFQAADRIPQRWIVGTPAQVHDELARFIGEYGFTDVVTWGSPPGLSPARMIPSLEKFAREVMPRLKEQFAGRTSA
jgi:alkanesulfonate monooxygenase SsuD/methylene tetrahydromethanopterin reductase-like flavin-dependent oxidoreductase (luciferase family)